ncbi:MAG: single-stranded DNA-binding protein [Flavobacterium psychrophilum]|nr:MAG: single-stranded DNA-binding protein [Flavobacterium psychrophilum]
MEIITARITDNATTKSFESGKSVVNFTVAINERYKVRGSKEVKKYTRFVECSYWGKPGVAPYITSGGELELYGRFGSRAFLTKNGEPKAVLTFNVRELFFKSTGKKGGKVARVQEAPTFEQEPMEDLPF